MLSSQQAWDLIAATVRPCEPVSRPLLSAWNSVLAENVVSTTDSPPFDKSMMDGFAVRASDVAGTDVLLQIRGEIAAGSHSTQPVEQGSAPRIMTGAPLPPGADAVVPVEWTEVNQAEGTVRVCPPREVTPGLNILPRGQMMREGDVILEAGRRLRSQEIAILAENGIAAPRVRPAPRVAILATGNELVSIDQQPGPGQIRNSNAVMLAAQVLQAGGEPVLLPVARDSRDELAARIQEGLACDFLCLSGGVSAGEYDLVPAELKRAGVNEVFHKVAMKPGKPVWFGQQSGAGECSVFGLPGNPVSSMVCFELFVRTGLRRFQGIDPAVPQLRPVSVACSWEYRSDRPTWFPARIEMGPGGLQVHPVDWKGSADLRSCVEANCSLALPAGEIRLAAGQAVDVLPWGQTMTLE